MDGDQLSSDDSVVIGSYSSDDEGAPLRDVADIFSTGVGRQLHKMVGDHEEHQQRPAGLPRTPQKTPRVAAGDAASPPSGGTAVSLSSMSRGELAKRKESLRSTVARMRENRVDVELIRPVYFEYLETSNALDRREAAVFSGGSSMTSDDMTSDDEGRADESLSLLVSSLMCDLDSNPSSGGTAGGREETPSTHTEDAANRASTSRGGGVGALPSGSARAPASKIPQKKTKTKGKLRRQVSFGDSSFSKKAEGEGRAPGRTVGSGSRTIAGGRGGGRGAPVRGRQRSIDSVARSTAGARGTRRESSSNWAGVVDLSKYRSTPQATAST